jgi:hypothetical protein
MNKSVKKKKKKKKVVWRLAGGLTHEFRRGCLTRARKMNQHPVKYIVTPVYDKTEKTEKKTEGKKSGLETHWASGPGTQTRLSHARSKGDPLAIPL